MRIRRTRSCLVAVVIVAAFMAAGYALLHRRPSATKLDAAALERIATYEGVAFSFDDVVVGPWDEAYVFSGYESPRRTRALAGFAGVWRLPKSTSMALWNDGMTWIAFVHSGAICGYYENRRFHQFGTLESSRPIRRGEGKAYVATRRPNPFVTGSGNDWVSVERK